MKNKNNAAIKESLKNDCSKVAQVMYEMNEKKKQQVLDLDGLTNAVTRIEEEIAQLHKKYKRATEEQTERYACKCDAIKWVILKFMNSYFSISEQV